MSYADKSTRNLTLPSGATCKVRKLAQSDSLSLGEFPVVLSDDGAGIENRKPTQAEIRFGVGLNTIMLTRCVADFRSGDERYKIVEKPWGDCLSGELAVELLDDKDAAAILDAVRELSGMTKEAAKAAKPFSEEQPLNGAGSPYREALPGSADRLAETRP